MCKKVRRTAAGVIAVALLWLSSCTATNVDYFDDYRDANLLADASKGMAQFALGFGYEEQAVPVGSFEYATVTELTTPAEIGSTDGLPHDASVYRFEIHDLLSNGDLEGADISHWSTTGDGTRSIVDETMSTDHAISNRSLDFWLSTDQFLILDLAAPDVVADGFVLGGEYALSFDFNADPNIAALFFSFTSSAPDYVPEDWVVDLAEIEDVDYETHQFPTSTGRSGRFSIPSVANTSDFRIGRDSYQQSGTLDNIRLSRTDIRPYVEITLSADEMDPTRPLIGGSYYEFSVYVKPEAPENVTPQTPGRYRANGVTLWANGQVYSESSESWPAGEWTKVTQRFELTSLAIPDDGSATAVRLRVSPTIYSDQDAGSLLIASPELVFDPPATRALW
jgi:hypothetical protein